MNGHAYAGGFIFGLCHDFRIIQSNGVLCLSEINNGLPLPPAYNTICSELLPIQLARKMNFGSKINAKEALSHNAVNGVYQELAEAEKYIAAFTKEFARRAEVGDVLAEIKRKLHKEIIEACNDVAFSPKDFLIVIDFIS